MIDTWNHRSFDLDPQRRPRPRGGLASLLIATALLGACADADVEGAELEDSELELEPRIFDAPDPDMILRMGFNNPDRLDAADDLFPDRALHAECEGIALTPVNDHRRAAGFDGQESACSFTISSGADASGASAVTMALWVRPREMDGILYRQHNGPHAGYQIDASNGKLRVGGRAKSTDPYGSIQLDYPFALDTWHHVVGVIDYEANRISIYLDGALALTQDGVLASGPTFEFTEDSAEMIGAYLPGGYAYFDGRMDELRVYRRALGASDVQTLYLATLGGDESEPQVHLEFESADLGENSADGGDCVANGIESDFAHTLAIYDGESVCSFSAGIGELAAGWGSATVSAWINPASSAEGTIYRQETAAGYAGYQLIFLNGSLRFGGRSTWSEPYETVLYPWPHAPSSGWHHVAGVIDYEQRDLRLYVDGVLQASSTPTWDHRTLQLAPGTPGPITGMRFLDGTAAYEGGLDELRVYSRSFADDEIAELF